MKSGVLTINAGSSSIKFALFALNDGLTQRAGLFGKIDGIGATRPRLIAQDASGKSFPAIDLPSGVVHQEAFAILLQWLAEHDDGWRIVAVGHRVTHGGERYTQAVRLTPEIIADLADLADLAPLHQPHNLAGIAALSGLLPDAIQIACFDTAFHRTQTRLAQLFALPRALSDEGIKRYGFHGLSYEYIAHVLPEYTAHADGRVIVAHLGNGASLCALHGRHSQATSMGFTAIDGLMMGTRSGALDPGVVLYLLENKRMSIAALTHLLYRESGLLGVSGISQDMRVLLASSEPAAVEAVDLFCYRAILEIGALTAALGGLDTLVFTGGIGENADEIRRRIAQGCAWLGLQIDAVANTAGRPHIEAADSRIEALVIPTDEEWMIAQHVCTLLASSTK